MEFLRRMFGFGPREEETQPVPGHEPARIPRLGRPAGRLPREGVPVPSADAPPFHVLQADSAATIVYGENEVYCAVPVRGPAFKPKGYPKSLIANQRSVVPAPRYATFRSIAQQNRRDPADGPLEKDTF
ncbi:hypothetical protein IFR05_003173 [Cadophora sp. M221]|nr:hypothetical protein IFR05_003173 [Cadophora sp. M221]